MSLNETMKNIGPARIVMMAVFSLGAILFLIFLMTRITSNDMSLLYRDLNPADSSEIAAELQSNNIPFKVTPDGREVSVPSTEVGKARMILAQSGLPNGGSVGYEIFDESSGFGTTRFEQNIRQLRALEGELVRTISTLDGIRSARVHLVLPQREMFSRTEQQATASVFLELRSSGNISGEQISSIQHLVAAAVPKLNPKRVSIVDQNGSLLASGTDTGSFASGQGADAMRRNFEDSLRRNIEDMVGQIVGRGSVRVNLSADMNFDRVEKNAELYDPEGQIARSTRVISENNSEVTRNENNNVSVENNIPNFGGTGTENADTRNVERTEEITNFEISKTLEHSVREGGQINRLSVAVLVDGRYEENQPDGEQENTEGEESEEAEVTRTYIPRSQEELDQIERIVAAAIGYDAARGDEIEIVNMQFDKPSIDFPDPVEEEKIAGFLKEDLLKIAETFVVGLVGILVVLLVLKPLAMRFVDISKEAAARGDAESTLPGLPDQPLLPQGQQQSSLPPPQAGQAQGESEQADETLVNMDQVQGRVRQSALNKVNELVEKHPQETVNVIRNWMSNE